MKTFTKIISGLVLASASLCATAGVHLTDNTGVLNLKVTDTAPKSFTIDLTNDGFDFFAPGSSKIDSAVLHITLSDPFGDNEKFSIFLSSTPGTAALSDINILNNGNTVVKNITLDAAALALLSTTGKIVVTFEAALQGGNNTTADYNVVSASLDANVVPEPASLALMGITLAGLGVARRRKQNKQD